MYIQIIKFDSWVPYGSLLYNALLIVWLCLKFDRNSNPKLVVKYAKHMQKRKTKKREQLKILNQ